MRTLFPSGGKNGKRAFPKEDNAQRISFINFFAQLFERGAYFRLREKIGKGVFPRGDKFQRIGFSVKFYFE